MLFFKLRVITIEQWPVGQEALLACNFVIMLFVARYLFNETVSSRSWMGGT